MAKPLLLLDVDGVLIPFVTGPGYVQIDEGIAYSETNSQAIRSLYPLFDIVWATSWENDANKVLSPIMDIGPFPVITFRPAIIRGFSTWKLPSVMEYVGDRPCVWIDDELGDDALKWERHRNDADHGSTLLISPHPNVGVTPKDWTLIGLWGAWHLPATPERTEGSLQPDEEADRE